MFMFGDFFSAARFTTTPSDAPFLRIIHLPNASSGQALLEKRRGIVESGFFLNSYFFRCEMDFLF